MGKKKKNRKRGDRREEQVNPEEQEEITESEVSGSNQPYEEVEESPFGFMLVDTDDHEIEPNPLDEDTEEDSLYVGTNADDTLEEMAEYTDDAEVLEDFSERQQMTAGNDELLGKLVQETGRSPELSGDDIDADWEGADQSGEETVGGTVATPDQDIVENLGEAVGVEYEPQEPLDTYGKLRERDLERWELEPESAEDFEETVEEVFGEQGRETYTVGEQPGKGIYACVDCDWVVTLEDNEDRLPPCATCEPGEGVHYARVTRTRT